MINLLKRIFGDPNEKEVKRLLETVERINALEPKMQAMSDFELRGQTEHFKERFAKGESLDQLLPEAFAVVREAGLRVIGQRLFDVQLLGAIKLHQGGIAEMRTGEGKTNVATAPAYLNALAGHGVHVVTVNDYLARFQGERMGQIYRFLNLKVGIIIHDLNYDQRREAYLADITYGTNNEFGFDYLRDNMVVYKEQMVQRDLHYAIIDEVDSILIDEARTPLIISGMGEESTDLYTKFADIARRLRQGESNENDDRLGQFSNLLRDTQAEEAAITAEGDFTVDEKNRSVAPTEACVRKVERMLDVDNLMAPEHNDLYHHLVIAIKARALFKLDVDYVVRDGEVIIVDEFTGRLMFGRRYSDGLHQAIEAKEGVTVAKESRTLATITLQNYFRMYTKLSGMTGTALTEEGEFRAIYSMDVLVVPTNKPMIRDDLPDLVYKNEPAKFRAVVEEIKRRNALGQPLLVGTISVEKSEYLSSLLKRDGVPHQVLNAKYHDQEAEIVAQAGHSGMVTIATNMAGRGTDIILGGNPDYRARGELRKLGYDDELMYQATSLLPTTDEMVLEIRKNYQEMLERFTRESQEDAAIVVETGGVHILGTERHEARRIDNQLRGRSGRQGDPGSSQFFISLQDDLMRLFGSDRLEGIMDRLGVDEDIPIEHSMVTSAIENAQRRVESRNFDVRKGVLEYDDVMNQQRTIIYQQRRQVLEGEDLRETVLKEMVYGTIDLAFDQFCDPQLRAEEWDIAALHRHLTDIFPIPETLDLDSIWAKKDRQEARELYYELADKAYAQREAIFGEAMRELERMITLRVVDTKWMQHIDDMQELRDGIRLRAFAQKDPLVEYKVEGHGMFEAMIADIREEIARMIFRVQVRMEQPIQRVQVAKPSDPNAGIKQQPIRRTEKKIQGRGPVAGVSGETPPGGQEPGSRQPRPPQQAPPQPQSGNRAQRRAKKRR